MLMHPVHEVGRRLLLASLTVRRWLGGHVGRVLEGSTVEDEVLTSNNFISLNVAKWHADSTVTIYELHHFCVIF